ncbi:cytochrome P450 [Catelliglobosispora koreensis]|uniref:cytochrome P450 n=1 Tax=Catelliglobosispora koreensis TaxID=129052 RepID=UPI000374766D|nr:cytochrome P450 [Catelliglobosispora koreensis]
MTVVRSSEVAFDVRDPALVDDPFPTYAAMREAGPILRGGPGQWIVPRYQEVSALLKDQRLTKTLPEAYYRYTVGNEELSAFLSGQNLGQRNRLASKVLVGSFSPGLVKRLGSHMTSLVDDLLDAPLAKGEMDIVTDLALPFPLMVICELLGVPAQEREVLWPHAATLVRAFSDVAFLSDKDVDDAAAALRWLREYLTDLLKRGPEPDSLLSRMATTEADGEKLTPPEIVDNAITVFYAGFETSMGMVSNGIVQLMSEPAQLARLRADRTLIASTVEEMLRFEAPIQVTMRSPLESIDVAGQTVRPGRVLFLLVGSANRDSERFADPDHFDIGRDPNPHLSFGAGSYKCVGAALARAEGAAVLDRLLARVADFEPAAAPQRRPRFNFRTYERVPVRLTPA